MAEFRVIFDDVKEATDFAGALSTYGLSTTRLIEGETTVIIISVHNEKEMKLVSGILKRFNFVNKLLRR